MNDKNIKETNSEKPNLIEKKAEKWLNVPRPNAFEDRIYYNRYHNRKIGYTAGYTQAITDQQDTLTQYKEALRKLVELADMIKITDTTNDSFEFTCKLSKAITDAENLLNNE